MCTRWHLFSLEIGCRIWIEWVPSDCNPADILSRQSESLFHTTSGEIDILALPAWVDMRGARDINEILERVRGLSVLPS